MMQRDHTVGSPDPPRGSEATPARRVDRAALAAHAEAILSHPGFREALARYTSAGLDTFDGRPRDAKLVCQTSRYVLAMMILYLDATATPETGGATVSRLQEMFAIGGFASAGWVKTAVRVFQRAGYVDTQQPAHDRRRKQITPSAALLDIAQRALTPMLHAAEAVAVLPRPAPELARAPGFVGAVATHTLRPYLVDGFTPLEAFPQVAALLMRDFGYLVFCHLVHTMRRRPDGTILAQAPSVVLARRFGMARAQARNVLAMAQEAQWLTIVGRGGHEVLLTPQFAEICERWVAHDLAWWCHLSRVAGADVGLTTRAA